MHAFFHILHGKKIKSLRVNSVKVTWKGWNTTYYLNPPPFHPLELHMQKRQNYYHVRLENHILSLVLRLSTNIQHTSTCSLCLGNICLSCLRTPMYSWTNGITAPDTSSSSSPRKRNMRGTFSSRAAIVTRAFSWSSAFCNL